MTTTTRYEIGEVLPNGATVTRDDVTVLVDGTVVEEIQTQHENGSVDYESTRIPGEGTVEANETELQSKGQVAMVDNVTYLGVKKPGQAALVGQVEALTRQVNVLLRLVLAHYRDTTGT